MKIPLLPFLFSIAIFAFAGLSCDRASFDDTSRFFSEEGHGAHEGNSHSEEDKHARGDKEHEKHKSEKKH